MGIKVYTVSSVSKMMNSYEQMFPIKCLKTKKLRKLSLNLIQIRYLQSNLKVDCRYGLKKIRITEFSLKNLVPLMIYRLNTITNTANMCTI